MKSPIILFTLALVAGGCSTPQPSPSSELIASLPLVRNYEPSQTPSPCTTHSDQEIDELQKGIYRVGTQKGFLIDGRYAKEGAIIFYRPGKAGPITVLVAIFRRKDTGLVVMEPSTKSMMPDQALAAEFSRSVTNFLSGK